ncbi:GntR family transcriptional regulator [Lacticaseibacillus kribbianus]|uniref:GntR family transcriptional regulator n=1 Tax=Lacticaseibacillus kribbianus TaxID=2926292 RepID=UPI001CD3C154|nr:GntR family transcriptional regulator [Lacticaseibacillus kribbianus]
MDITISNQAGSPIYEQIEDQIKAAILTGAVAAGTQLPSIRALARDLHISVITTTRAYRELEAAGFIDTVPGKGAFVRAQDPALIHEQGLARVEAHLQAAIDDAALARVPAATLHEMLDDLLKAGDDHD